MNKIKSFRRLITFILIPVVVIGFIYIFRSKNVRETSAVDYIQVFYDGKTPMDPIYVISGMLPGDTSEKILTINNVSTENLIIHANAVQTEAERDFSEVLEITFSEDGGADLYGGSLGTKTISDFFSETVNLGVIPAGTSKDFRVKIYFPHLAGNEFQSAKLVFDLSFSAVIVPISLPAECASLEGIISEVIEGSDFPDVLFGTEKSELILAKGGADLISSGEGPDCIIGGDSGDVIFTGSGSIVVGGTGNDRISVGSGDEKVYGGDGDDVIFGNSGNDYIDGGSGFDQIDGGSGTDECYNSEIKFNCEL